MKYKVSQKLYTKDGRVNDNSIISDMTIGYDIYGNPIVLFKLTDGFGKTKTVGQEYLDNNFYKGGF